MEINRQKRFRQGTSDFKTISPFCGWQDAELDIILIKARKLLYNAGGQRYNNLLFER